jgi:hypothetical protein
LNEFTITVDSITSATAIRYFWDFGDDSTSTSPVPKHVFKKDSVYRVCMKTFTSANDSCTYCNIMGKDSLGNIYRTSGFSLNIVNNISLTGIKQNKNDYPAFYVFPNPTKGEIKILFDQTNNNINLKLMSLTGQTVLEKNNTNDMQFSFDIASLTSGMYILEINNNGIVTRTKVLKE